MILPNPESAIIDEDKLSGYSLNTEHSEGKHSVWIVRSDEDFPRLITCYVL
jgi:hypothetical protein